MTTTTYTKLSDGSWGLRTTERNVGPGANLRVTKRSGESKSETVGRVVWTGNGVTLATIERSSGPATSRLTTEEREDRGDYSHHFHGR